MSTSNAVTTQPPSLSSEDRSARIAVTVFPLLILAAFVIAMVTPATFKPLAPGVNWALGVIMFGMGLTLTLPDFGLIIKRPLPVLVGVVAQYLIMPLVGWSLCYVFRLPDAVAVGVILVGCAPGGTASNVISYLAKADVALSVTMTSISTLLAPLMTPLLTAWLVGSRMPVDGAAMAQNILLMVLAPVLGGFIVRFVAGQLVEKILPILPWISVLGICYVLLVVVSGVGRQDPDVGRSHHRGGHLPQPAGLPLRLPGRTRRTRLGQSLSHDSNRGRHAELRAGCDAGEDPLRRHPRNCAPGGRLLRLAQPLWRAPGGLLPSLEERWSGLKRRGLGALGRSCRADGWGWRVDTARADK